MKQQLKVEHFQFEQDFMEDNIRCIPMIVRFKLDACSIKLKLNEWNKMSFDEREQLTALSIDTTEDVNYYRTYVQELVLKHAGRPATPITPEMINTNWTREDELPVELDHKLAESKMFLTIDQWRGLSLLKRFALIKLTRPGHENKNFPKAMKEFGLA